MAEKIFYSRAINGGNKSGNIKSRSLDSPVIKEAEIIKRAKK